MIRKVYDWMTSGPQNPEMSDRVDNAGHQDSLSVSAGGGDDENDGLNRSAGVGDDEKGELSVSAGGGGDEKGGLSVSAGGGGDEKGGLSVSASDEKDELDGPFKTLSLDSDEFVYNMRHPKRGKFVIINNRTFLPATGMNERTGTDADAASLYQIFQKFGFDVSLYHNQTKDQMLKLMISAAGENHSDRDCFGVAVLSHGDADVLYGTDNIIAIDNFVAPIKKCKTLVGKPKLFIFQACRGSDFDNGMLHQSDAVGDVKPPSLVIPMEADMLYAYSTVPGYFSWRNSSKGSWFVQAMAQILSRPETEKMDFVRVLTRVSHAVAYQFESNASRPEMNRKKQVPSVVSMLTKDLYLGPKK